jgi:hypothetical protein
MSTHSFREAVAERFKAQPNTWISAYVLMQCGGAMAWRTRISECRTQLGMRIDCNVERDANGVAVSYYRFVPAVAKQASLFDIAS